MSFSRPPLPGEHRIGKAGFFSGRFLALMTRLFEFAKILTPHLLVVGAHLVKRFPGVDTGVMAIVKMELHGIVANRLDTLDVDILLAGLQHALVRRMPLNFR